MTGKAIIVSAPSGAGKTTLVKSLLNAFPQLAFSVSACSRPKRESETQGKDYYFISADEFNQKIRNNEFAEWEEVYPGSFYGTLKSEIERIWASGKAVIFDVDVVGGVNLKKYFGESALGIFIEPPSVEELGNRLRTRNTESPETLQKRIDKAHYELTFAEKFDRIIRNDELEKACREVSEAVEKFLNG
jgi:guanylate kinase